MRGAHCFFYPFTDLGWHSLYANGSSAGPRKEGFIWHSEPGCVHLPANTRFCFHRCDTASCMLQEARPAFCHAFGVRSLGAAAAGAMAATSCMRGPASWRPPAAPRTAVRCRTASACRALV